MGNIKDVNIDLNKSNLKEMNNSFNKGINNIFNDENINTEILDLNLFNKKENKKRTIDKAGLHFDCVNRMEKTKNKKRVYENYQYVNYYYDDDGKLFAKYFENNHLVVDYTREDALNWAGINYYRYYPNGKEKHISIYDEDNIYSKQYGAKQEVFKDKVYDLMKNPYIKEEMDKYYPKSKFDSEEDYTYFIEKYFEIMKQTGCGYSAEINTIFKEYEGQESDFKRVFGFPMYEVNDETGKIDFNYEIMFLKYYNYTNAGKYKLKKMADSAEIEIVEDYNEPASLTSAKLKKFDNFLKDEYDIDCKIKKCNVPHSINNGTNEGINEYLKEEFENYDSLVYSGTGWTLCDLNGNVIDDRGGGHSLAIVGFTNDDYPIVSSWGKRFVLHINDQGEDSKYNIYGINYYENDEKAWY